MTTIGVVFVRHSTRIKLISILPAYRQTVDKGSMHQRFSKAKVAEEGKAQQRDIAIPAFGYKNHASIDRRHGFIRGWNVTSASAYDGAQLRNVLNRGNTGSTVWADTAYRSKKNYRSGWRRTATSLTSTRRSRRVDR
ncbi:IS5 family transposase [Mesorhizobium jarvisii]